MDDSLSGGAGKMTGAGEVAAGGTRIMFALALAVRSLCAASLEIRVIEDHSGRPVANVEVRVSRAGLGNLAADLETDRMGLVRVPDLAVGDYGLAISKPLYVPATTAVKVADAPTALTVRLIRCAVVTGRVMGPDGGPARNAQIYVMTKAGANGPLRPLGAAHTPNESGEYRVLDLGPGQYAFAVTYGSIESPYAANPDAFGVLYYPNNANPQMFTVTGGEEFRSVDFVNGGEPLYRISGAVDPVQPGARMIVALAPHSQPALRAACAKTGADGSFRIVGVPAGSYELFVSGPATGYCGTAAPGSEPVFARSHIEVFGENADGVSLRAEERRSLKLTLRIAEAAVACPASARVTLRPAEDWGVWLDRSVELRADRELTIENLAPGRYFIDSAQLSSGCYTPTAEVDLTSPREGPALALTAGAGGAVRGRLLVDAQQAGGLAIMLVRMESEGDPQPVRISLSDPQARFEFEGLRPGRYRIGAMLAAPVEASSGSGRAPQYEIEVRGGSPTEVDLPVAAAAGPREERP